jgi:hypothetical protein
MKHWRDWAMLNLLHRPWSGPQSQALHFSYEKAGLTLEDQPIPWNAEAVLVKVLVRLPPTTPRRKSDFTIRLSNHEPIPAEQLRREETGDHHYRVTFRLPTPQAPTTADIYWRDHLRGQVTLPTLSRDEFVNQFRLQMPTLFVRLGEENVACQTFVASQGKGLIASALLTSPTSLVPLLDLGLQVEFRSDRSGQTHLVPARLCSTQLAGRQALVTVTPPRCPRGLGMWTATWLLGDIPLATQRVRAISQRHFQRSLRISDTRFVVRTEKHGVTVTRHVPVLEKGTRVGPCFLVSSREPGMAGLCHLHIRAQVPGAAGSLPLLEQELLVTDGPTMFAPGTLEAGDLSQMHSFELRLKDQTLGILSLCPAPTATFTTEGGYKAPSEFSWSAAADEELNERLARLVEGRGDST